MPVRSERTSCAALAAATSLLVPAGRSSRIPPAASRRQLRAKPMTSARWSSGSSPRLLPVNSSTVWTPSRMAIGWRWRTSRGASGIAALSVMQPASIAVQPTIASSRVAPIRIGIAAERSVDLLDVLRGGPSIEDEAVIAAIGALGVGGAGDPVDAVEIAQQYRRRIAGIGESVVGTDQIL